MDELDGWAWFCVARVSVARIGEGWTDRPEEFDDDDFGGDSSESSSFKDKKIASCSKNKPNLVQKTDLS